MSRALATRLRPGAWPVDLATAESAFEVRTFRRTVRGSVPVRAGSVVVGADREIESVTGTVELAGLVTDNARRDRDLRKPSLLDLDTHPEATFTSDRVTATAEGWCATGTFAARGRTIPLEFAVTVDGETWTGTASFDRRALGVKAPSVLIGRTITVTVHGRLLGAGG